MKNFSAYIEDVAISALPKDTRVTVEKMITVKKGTKVPQYGMTVKELIPKADQHNLKTARKHVANLSAKKCQDEVQKRLSAKFILLLNDRIIDGHHFLAKAERGRATNSLMVLDLTPTRFQFATRSERFKNTAVGDGALAAGGGIAYAGIRAGKAAKQVGAAATDTRAVSRNARIVTAGVVRTGRRIERATRFIKRTVAKLPGIRFEAKTELAAKKEKKPLPSSVKAGISAAVSGGALGLIPAFRKGTGLKKILKSVAGGAVTGAALGGGGTAIGTAILGQPKRNEGAPITKRAAIGGGIGGAILGGAGIVVLRKGGRGPARALVRASKTWRPASLARKAPLPLAAALGAGGGAVIGASHAADEGQQVDTINSLKKDRKKRRMFETLPSRLRATIEFAIGYEAGIALTGKVARDRYVKKIRDEDLDRRDANLLRSGLAGAAVGVLTRGKMKALRRAAIGAAAGGAAVLGVRAATRNNRDPYGERNRGSKRAEGAPAVAGVATAAVLAQRRLFQKLPRRFAATLVLIELGKRDQPRFRDSKQYADPLRAYGENASLVDAAGNSTRLTQSQLVNAAWRGGHQIRKAVRRSSNIVTDVADIAQGRAKTGGRKREWEKEYFRNGIISAASAAGLLGHAVARRKLPGYRTRTDRVGRAVKAQVQKIRNKVDGGLGLSSGAGEIFLARVEATLLFDALSAERGWDLRDPRGRSARVFAPGSRKRMRRKADFHETKDGQRKILGTLGLAGTVAGLAGGIAIGRRISRKPNLFPAVKSHQRPGYQSKRIKVVSRRAFRKAGDEMV